MEQQQAVQTDRTGFTAAVSGGLNTTASRLAMPEEDSPDLLNVNINYDGSVSKREGFDIYEGTTPNETLSSPRPRGATASSSYYTYGTKATPFSVVFHRYQSTPAAGIGMEMTLLRDKVFSNPRGWTSAGATVWSSLATVKPDITVIQDSDRIRLLYLTGTNVPVQFTIKERDLTFASNLAEYGAIAGSPTLNETNQWSGIRANNTFLINKTTLVVYSGAFSVNKIAATVPNGDYWCVFVSWQWWCCAQYVRGDWCQDVRNRFAVDAVRDRTIPVPTNLLNGIVGTEYSTTLLPYPITLNNTAGYTGGYTFTQTGTGATDFQFSSGFTSTSGVVNQPSPNFVTFGVMQAGIVRFDRGFRADFNSTIEIDESQCSATITNAIDGFIVASRNTSGSGTASPSWQKRVLNYAIDLPGSGAAMKWWSFDGMNNGAGSQIKADWDIYFSYTQLNSTYVGTGALSAPTGVDLPLDGYPWAAPGLWEIANYEQGDFPDTGTIFQGRLYLAGFSKLPGAILVSDLYDTTQVGVFYKSFQLEVTTGEAESPFDISVGLQSADDIIKCVREWQNSLWIFSKYSVYRLTGGNAGISYGTFSLQATAGVGVINSQSVALTDQALMFLSNQGLYKLVPAGGLSDAYAVEEVSSKIRTVFEDRRNMESLAYLVWDSVRQNLYMALPTTSTTRTTDFFVYFAQRNAWSRWADGSGEGLFTKHAFMSYNTPSDSDLYIAHLVTTPTYQGDTVYEGYRISRYPNQYFVDVCTGAVFSGNWAKPCQRVVYYTLEDDVFEYSTTVESSGQVTGFKMLPFTDVQDVEVYQNTVKLQFGTDYYKTLQSTIVLNFESAGQPIVIEQRTTELKPTSSVVGYKRIVTAEQTTAPTSPTIATTNPIVYGNPPISGAAEPLYAVAIQYPAYHSTITMSRGTLANYKRMKTYFGYYRNELGKYLERLDILVGESLELIGTTVNSIGVSIVVLFNDEADGSPVMSEILGSDDLFWDAANLGQATPPKQSTQYTRAFVPIIGGAYSFNVVNFSFDEKTWRLVGYEMQVKVKQGKGLSRTD